MEEIQKERRSSSTDIDRYATSDEEGLLSKRDPELRSHARKTWLHQASTIPMSIVHITLILGYTLLFLILHLQYNTRHPGTIPAREEHLVYSPLNPVLVPEKKFVHATFRSKNPYKGAPSPELDHAWHELFVNSNVRVSASDLKKINKTSVPVGDGEGGYYAIPDVYHQLHCLKFLRQMLYNDYYQINKPTNPIHIDHCIDNLRQNLMCKADVSLLTFAWVPNDRAPKPDFDIEHECKNWDRVEAWAQEHMFDIFDENTLVHPTLGPSFPGKEYKDTGRIPGHPGFLHGHGEKGEHNQTEGQGKEEEYGGGGEK